jgi:hypothetical protein
MCVGGSKGTAAFKTGIAFMDFSGNRMSGTLPPCMFREFGVDYFNLMENRFSGPLPDLQPLRFLQKASFRGNDFSSFPPAFPVTLKLFNADENPAIFGTGAEVGMLLQSAPDLQDFSVAVDNSMRNAWFATHGELPYIVNTVATPRIPLTCYVGEVCGFDLRLLVWTQAPSR